MVYPPALLVALGARADEQREPYNFVANKGIVVALLHHGANVNCSGTSNISPITQAANYCSLDDDLIKLLVQHGANVTAKTSGGDTVLIPAVLEDHVELAQSLIDHGACARNTEHQNQGLLIDAAVANDFKNDTIVA